MSIKESVNFKPPIPDGVTLIRTLEGHYGSIGRIKWSPNGQLLASPSRDEVIRIWDIKGNCIHKLKAHSNSVYSVSFNPRGDILASGSYDKQLNIWDVKSGKLLHSYSGHESVVYGCCFDLLGKRVISGDSIGQINIWNIENKTLEKSIRTNISPVSDIALDPKGKLLIVTGYQEIAIYCLKTYMHLATLERQSHSIHSARYNPSGDIIVSAGSDHAIKLWDATNKRVFGYLEGHTAKVNYAEFSSDGELIVSKSDDNTIRLWKSKTGNCIAVIPEPNDKEYWTAGASFHPTQPLLATVGTDPNDTQNKLDQVIHIWQLDVPYLVKQTVAPTITYTSAKIVLVGESNVGKSYLAHRIVNGKAPDPGLIKSTHGMMFWQIKPEILSDSIKTPKNQLRDVTFWDLGGQEEYRLVHQLFLTGTTIALVLFDPTRGNTAYKEVETWNTYLDKQLHGRTVVKLLVGTKVDEKSQTIVTAELQKIVSRFGFAGYFETSAITGRGVSDLCNCVANSIDWDNLGKTNRPALFQHIRDIIETKRRAGEIILNLKELYNELSISDYSAESDVISAVTEQLAKQGTIAILKSSDGEPVIILQVHKIEQYAGSLIIAARNNPRGVPALELQAITTVYFSLPGLKTEDRLPQAQEKVVLECTVQLLLEHGICFQHEGVLIFPTLFSNQLKDGPSSNPQSVSLYYDFSGAIDNIYASLIAWLVLAQNFGRVRLWADRGEFETQQGGLCGLRKVTRSGGFARIDLYFEEDTLPKQRVEFVAFVEQHLQQHGIEIHEHLTLKCICEYIFLEETLRSRIARGDTDILCPICEKRHDLVEGAIDARKNHDRLTEKTWALKTEIEKRRKVIKEHAVIAMDNTVLKADSKLRLLHLSDLHFTGTTKVSSKLQWLLDDLRQESGLNIRHLDYLIISGDFTDKGDKGGFDKALEFVSSIRSEFNLSAERCIFVPGNHDIKDIREAYDWQDLQPNGLDEEDWVRKDDIILVRNWDKYPLRFKLFSDNFYHPFYAGKQYPREFKAQGIAIPFWETGLQFLTLNSAWQIDRFHRNRSGIHPEALAHVLKEAQTQEEEARKDGKLKGKLLKIAIWHHAVAGPNQIKDITFLENLQKNNVKIGLHGDVHEMRRDLIGHEIQKHLHIVGAGSFGSTAKARPESTPRLYNLLEIDRGLKYIRVHTREQKKPEGSWDGWYNWESPNPDNSRISYYDINLEV